MRYFGAILLSLGLMAPALAQTAPPRAAPKPSAAPKPQATAKPAATAAKPNPVAESYAAIPDAERIAIQSDLIWTGDYNGTLSGEFGERAVAAVKAFQKRRGGKETGVLNPQERAVLSAAAKPKQEAVGWRMLNDGVSGVRLGLPAKLAPQATGIAGGSRWTSARGEVQIETFRIAAPGTTLQAAFEQQQNVAERKVSYKLLRPDFFIVSGLQGLKKVYVRGAFKDGEVRGFSILYDQALEGTVDPVVIAMSSAFAGFPPGVVAAPPPRRKVEYGTGVVIGAAGHVITTREVTDACQIITLAGLGPADLIAEDKATHLALLRVYGTRDLVPLAVGDGDGTDVTLVGVADPQSQGGGAAASTAAARVTSQGAARVVEPPPAPGFAGAAALARDGRLAGLVDLRPQVIAGPSPGTAQSALIAAETIATFLHAHQVAAAAPAAASGVEKAKAATVRVICVRK
jgi:peptidoglycan hydrolase-like protein with peptidoglycan-binding domain